MHISIHALHEESDETMDVGFLPEDISIHALHEESDLAVSNISSQQKKFQSTLSMRRATLRHPWRIHTLSISIHALHEESDGEFVVSNISSQQFQSTLSMRRATSLSQRRQAWIAYFNPRSP